MSGAAFERRMRREVAALLRDGLIDAATGRTLLARYPASTWSWPALGPWFAIFGAISAAAGAAILLADVIELTLEKLAAALAITTVALFLAGHRLQARALPWTGQALELAGGFALIGFVFTIGALLDTGTGDWPRLLLVDWLALVALAYLRSNALLLMLALVVFFTWFGGMTGYLSGWGAYWFGMNYPVRFLLAGLAIGGIGVLHRLAEGGPLRPFRGFFRIWLGAGLFFAEMALWLMSLFGNYETIMTPYGDTAAELLAYNLLWAGANGVLLLAGTRGALPMARGYAVTFLVIQGYTVFFQHVAGELGPVLSTFVAGIATLGAVQVLERRRRSARS